MRKSLLRQRKRSLLPFKSNPNRLNQLLSSAPLLNSPSRNLRMSSKTITVAIDAVVANTDPEVREVKGAETTRTIESPERTTTASLRRRRSSPEEAAAITEATTQGATIAAREIRLAEVHAPRTRVLPNRHTPRPRPNR